MPRSKSANARRGTSLSQDVYEQLRSDILRGNIEPAERLRGSRIASSYGVSLNVVREALSRLTGEGLVTSTPQIGYVVFEPSIDDFVDLAAVRVEIEGTALGWAIDRGDVTWEGEVLAANHRLKQTPLHDASAVEAGPTEGWLEVHHAFHSALLSASGSRRLASMASSLSDELQLYRRWALGRYAHPERDLAEEHENITQLAIARRRDEAIAALKHHILLTRDNLLKDEEGRANGVDQ